MRGEIDALNEKKDKIHKGYVKKYASVMESDSKEKTQMMKDLDHQKKMEQLKQIRSDRTTHLLITEGGIWKLGEDIKDTPEFIKIHIFIFSQDDKGACQVTLKSPSGEVLYKKKDSIGMVVQFYAEIKGEYLLEIKNLTG